MRSTYSLKLFSTEVPIIMNFGLSLRSLMTASSGGTVFPARPTSLIRSTGTDVSDQMRILRSKTLEMEEYVRQVSSVRGIWVDGCKALAHGARGAVKGQGVSSPILVWHRQLVLPVKEKRDERAHE